MGKTKKQRFFEELTKHYVDFAASNIKIVKHFADIKKKYPKEVELLRDFQKDANIPFTDGLIYKEKGRFYELMLRCGDLAKRFNIFYDLSFQELKQLEKDLIKLSIKKWEKQKK